MKINHWNYAFIDENGQVAGEAILHMRSKAPNSDGTIGYMAEPGSFEWRAWEAYFSQTELNRKHGTMVQSFPNQLAAMKTKGAQGKPYHVPDQLPWLFDDTFSPASVPKQVSDRKSSDMTAAERDAMVKRVLAHMNDPEVIRSKARLKWERDMCASTPADQISAYMDILAERPDLCDRATDMELTPKNSSGFPNGGYGLGWCEIRQAVEGIYRARRADPRRLMGVSETERSAAE